MPFHLHVRDGYARGSCLQLNFCDFSNCKNFYTLLKPPTCWIRILEVIRECTFLLCFLKRLSKHSFEKDPLSLAFYIKNLPEFTLPNVFPPPLMKREPHLWESHSVKNRHKTRWFGRSSGSCQVRRVYES